MSVKISLVKTKEKFLEYSAIGNQLVETHLMDPQTLQDMQRRGIHYTDEPCNRLQIRRVMWHEDTQRLYINDHAYFSNVPRDLWMYTIGGYQVLKKYLNSYKDEEIDLVFLVKFSQH